MPFLLRAWSYSAALYVSKLLNSSWKNKVKRKHPINTEVLKRLLQLKCIYVTVETFYACFFKINRKFGLTNNFSKLWFVYIFFEFGLKFLQFLDHDCWILVFRAVIHEQWVFFELPCVKGHIYFSRHTVLLLLSLLLVELKHILC